MGLRLRLLFVQFDDVDSYFAKRGQISRTEGLWEVKLHLKLLVLISTEVKMKLGYR